MLTENGANVNRSRTGPSCKLSFTIVKLKQNCDIGLTVDDPGN